MVDETKVAPSEQRLETQELTESQKVLLNELGKSYLARQSGNPEAEARLEKRRQLVRQMAPMEAAKFLQAIKDTRAGTGPYGADVGLVFLDTVFRYFELAKGNESEAKIDILDFFKVP